MIRTALLDPKGQRPFANALLINEWEVPAVEARAASLLGSDQPGSGFTLPSLSAEVARPMLRRALYPK